MAETTATLPRLLRAARGEELDRPPVWMMRQAGRYMKSYQDLSARYPSFRERSENADLAVEISLQPYHAFAPDGVILFSDILTPLPGMGIEFEIHPGKGPLIDPPIRTMDQVEKLTPFDPEATCPFVGKALKTLRQEVGNNATVLGFVGAPWTLAAYAVEGKSSKSYSVIKGMAFSQPDILHKLLSHLADSIANYVRYQIDSGAQLVQLFDSWAGQLSPIDYETFSLPYQQQIVQQVKQTHPDTPLVLYTSGSAGILSRMPKSGVDIISLDWTVDMAEARQMLGQDVVVQGNMDPGVLFGSQDFIQARIIDVIRKAGKKGHIMNLGHGILPGTPEENAAFFFETVKNIEQLL